MLENIEFTMTKEEYAFLQEHFEAERNGCRIDYVGGPFKDLLERANRTVDNYGEAMADFLSQEHLDLLLWYLHRYQDSHGIARTFV